MNLILLPLTLYL